MVGLTVSCEAWEIDSRPTKEMMASEVPKSRLGMLRWPSVKLTWRR